MFQAQGKAETCRVCFSLVALVYMSCFLGFVTYVWFGLEESSTMAKVRRKLSSFLKLSFLLRLSFLTLSSSLSLF